VVKAAARPSRAGGLKRPVARPMSKTDKKHADNSGDNDNRLSLSVFLPCYNEADNIERVAGQAIAVLENIGVDYELVIVDDGSRDGTGQAADRIAAENESVKVIHHPMNLGYGAALQSGFRAATKELVFYTDGDGQFDIKEMPALLPLMREYDIVSCFRINRRDNIIRKINAWCWTRLVNILFGMRIRDIDCAFKLYRREIFDDIEMSSKGALIDTEILAQAVRRGYRVAQRGVHHYPRTAGAQTGANIKVILRAFRELFRLYKRIRKSGS
jgi:glycosyltransferase involved in cell wall biosynthesis